MIPADIGAHIATALQAAVERGELSAPAPSGTWRPARGPGSYATSLPLTLAAGSPGGDAAVIAARIADHLRVVPWIGAARVTGGGYLTVTVTTRYLAALPARIVAAGPARAARGDALAGTSVQVTRAPGLAAAPSWEQAWRHHHAELVASLVQAAGGTIEFLDIQRPSAGEPGTPGATGPGGAALRPSAGVSGVPGAAGLVADVLPPSAGEPGTPGATGPGGAALRPSAGGSGVPGAAGLVADVLPPSAGEPGTPGATGPGGAALRPSAGGSGVPGALGPVATALAWHGGGAVRYALARTAAASERGIRRRLPVKYDLRDPFTAVCHAHADASSTLRWAGDLGLRPGPGEDGMEPAEAALIDLMSWLPERTAAAARRGRPAELTSYLEQLAGAWLDCREQCPALPFGGRAAPADAGGARARARLTIAAAASVTLAAGLALLGIDAPVRW